MIKIYINLNHTPRATPTPLYAFTLQVPSKPFLHEVLWSFKNIFAKGELKKNWLVLSLTLPYSVIHIISYNTHKIVYCLINAKLKFHKVVICCFFFLQVCQNEWTGTEPTSIFSHPVEWITVTWKSSSSRAKRLWYVPSPRFNPCLGKMGKVWRIT